MSDPIPTIAGVYMIRCRANERVYIGQSVDITGRWRDHHTALEAGSARPAWVEDWQRYGPAAFEWSVLETTLDRAALLELEARWIARCEAQKPGCLYNRRQGDLARERSAAAPLRPARPAPEGRPAVACLDPDCPGEARVRRDAPLHLHFYGYPDPARVVAAARLLAVSGVERLSLEMDLVSVPETRLAAESVR